MSSTEKPIIFSTPMVQAIMEGRKTQTRRIVDEYDAELISLYAESQHPQMKYSEWCDGETGRNHKPEWLVLGAEEEDVWPVGQLYGKPGDLLWVRETFTNQVTGKFYYKATGQPFDELELPWKPSIHMPKAAARIWLEITNIRVERLQEISEDDALSEGIQQFKTIIGFHYALNREDDFRERRAVKSFHSLWDSINGKKETANWNSNPWVWVITFKVLSTTGKPVRKKEAAHV